jgi:hypothetical protein
VLPLTLMRIQTLTKVRLVRFETIELTVVTKEYEIKASIFGSSTGRTKPNQL